MEKVLYLDCSSGISGDMFVAAMLDLGADQEVMKKTLNSLFVQGFEIRVSRALKADMDACDFLVALDEKHENHDHNMQYLHGDGEDHREERVIEHDHECRGLKEIRNIIQSADMTEGAKKLAMKIFKILAEAEAKAHGVAVEEIHFHEVGAVDSIADIVAAAVCFDNLGISKVIIPKLCDGTGTIRCRHGILKVPVPAVRNIDSVYQLNLQISDVEGELVTPTGAAIAAAIRTDKELPYCYSLLRIGLGAGKRQYKSSGILKAMMIKENNI